jgi:hypothetical protein
MIEDGAVWIKDGKIYQVGRIQQVAGGDRIMTCVDGCALQVRADMPMVDAREKWIFPGMIDAHTALGLVEIAKEPTVNDEDEGAVDPLTPQLRASDAIWPETAAIPVTRVEGITSVLVVPANHRFTYFGGGNVVAGQSALIDLAGNTVDEMLVKSPVGMHVNLGEWPKDRYRPKNKLPTTRMGTAALLRQALIDAKAYREKWDRYVKEGGEAPETRGAGTGGAAASGAESKAASPEDRAGAEPRGTEVMERPGPDRSGASRQGGPRRRSRATNRPSQAGKSPASRASREEDARPSRARPPQGSALPFSAASCRSSCARTAPTTSSRPSGSPMSSSSG